MVQWSNGPMVQWSNGPEGPVDRTCPLQCLEILRWTARACYVLQKECYSCCDVTNCFEQKLVESLLLMLNQCGI